VDTSLPDHPVVLLTGATSGIGLALARKLVEWPAGHIVLSARESSLPRFADLGIEPSERVWLRPLDVTSADQRERLVAEIRAELSGVDILINNAGVAYRSVTEHIDEDEMRRQLAANFVGPMDLARLVLRDMRAKRTGRILNISSVSGMMAMPTMGAYSGSKFALEGATESLWYEMKPWNVAVTLVQPGFIHSNSFRNVIWSEAARLAMDDEADPYHRVYRSMSPFVERLMNLARATPEHIADRVLRTLHRRKPRLRVFATIDARFFYLLRRVVPRRLFHALLYRALPGVGHWGPRG